MLELLLSILLTAPPAPLPYPIPKMQENISPLPQINGNIDSELSAISYLIIDTESNTILAEKNSDEELPIASLTKVMTAMIILEENKFDEEVTVSASAPSVEGAKLGLVENEVITVGELFKALLIRSGNDAAIALAEHNSGTVTKFVQKMNRRAKEIGMKNTHFKNPHGLDEQNHYSTVKDLLKLAQYTWKYEALRSTVSQKEALVESYSFPPRKIQNTNLLLSNKIKGIKTGTTDKAGQCLMLYVEHEGRSVFTIVLGSTKRYQDSEKLIREIWKKIEW